MIMAGSASGTGACPELPRAHARNRISGDLGAFAVEMVNFRVDAAIIEPGRDAAALLQRI
jgi:hypothetical protein